MISRIFKFLFGYAAVIGEAVILSHFICEEGTETTIFLILSFLIGFGAVLAVNSVFDDVWGFIGGMLLLIVLIPIASVILTIPIEFIALLFSTFGVEGTFGLSIIAAIILGVLSNCVFIFFF